MRHLKGILIMKKQAVFNTVRNVSLFASLTNSEITALIASGVIKKYETNDVIDSAHSITVILKGSVSVVKQTGDKKLLMRMFGAGNVSGVASLFSDDESNVSTLTALNPTEVLIINQETISSFIHENGRFAEDYIRFLTSRIRFLNSRIKAYTVSSAEAKLAFHLILADESERGEVDLHVSYSRLADMLDMGRASLYRAIDSLSAKGIIAKSKKKIIILNKSALHDAADGKKTV